MIKDLPDALSKKGPLSTLLIVGGLMAQALFYFVDEIADRSEIIAKLSWLFSDTILFAFLIVFVAYAAWILGLRAGTLVLGVGLTVLGLHIPAARDAATRDAELATLIIQV